MSIADEITRLQGGKANLKTSLNAKNDAEHQITDETIDEYYLFADSIPEGIDTSDATATANDIINPKTAYVNGQKVTGNISNNGALSYTPTTSQQTIPAGYTSGGTISAIQTETKTVTPSTSSQTITPTSGNFINEITVNAVTSSIDANIIARKH